MPKKKADISDSLLRRLRAKASCSPCTYKISGIAISKRGNILGIATNTHSRWQVLEKVPIGRAGTAGHVERNLLAKFGNRVKTIIICRVGRSGDILPIDPCPACRKAAAKYGVNIISVLPGDGKTYSWLLFLSVMRCFQKPTVSQADRCLRWTCLCSRPVRS